MNELQEQAVTVFENVEDTVEYICDTHMLSGEKVCFMIRALADCHINDFPDQE